MEVITTGGGVGAELRGVDVRAVDDAVFAALERAWVAHQVLLIRGQVLSPDDLIAFSRRLGQLDLAPIQETGRRFVEGHPELYIVSNVVVNGEPIGSLGASEAAWHTDMSYLPEPPKASLLYAVEVPPVGGDTSFLNMVTAWETLPDALKAQCRGRRVKHDGTYNSGGFVRQGVSPIDDPQLSPGHLHPMVCTHPESGRTMLYLGRRRNAYIEGLAVQQSEALLDAVWDHIDQPAHEWTHRWQVGDLVMWDNRCTMHRRDAFDASTRRVMHRTQVKGVAPSAV